jgi:hypothetical protein
LYIYAEWRELLDELYDKNHRVRAIEDNPRLVRYMLLN